MNYEPNTQHWAKGDVVIHDCDAKEPKMLMVVIGYSRGGLCKTQYVDKRRARKVWRNEIKDLHNPERFGIEPMWGNYNQIYFPTVQDAWENVRIWNHNYSVGQSIITTSADGGFEAVTGGKAYIDKAGQAMIWIVGHRNWSLRFVQAVKKIDQP